MKCLENINRTHIPNDIVMNYVKLYKSIGNNSYNHDTLESDNSVMVRQTITSDIINLAQILELKVSEGRIKSLIYKGVLPKNKDEKLILNLNSAFDKIHNETDTFELLPNEIQDMLKFIFKDVVSDKKLQFARTEKTKQNVTLLSSAKVSKREELDGLIKLFNEEKKNGNYEISFLISNFYIDFLKLNIFADKNEEIAIILLYVMLITNDYEVYNYISFFSYLNSHYGEFKKSVLESAFNYEEGYASTIPLHRYILRISLFAYDELNAVIRNYEFDKNLNKSNNVENTINKLEEIFTKDDIRNAHPYISDSTINRTLKRLRDEEKIRPLGKGRSAKWIKLYNSPEKKITFEQLDLKL
jgi:hypothetical protein